MTERGKVALTRPLCGDDTHTGWKVWRDGYVGVPPSRRQRWRCVNPTNRDDWHRFTLDVLRVEASQRHCSDCQRPVPVNAGAPIAFGYHYYSTVVAETLTQLARGVTYADASASARRELARADASRSERLGQQVPGMGEPLAHGQLAADWLEAFGPTVLDEPGPWPDVLLLDSTEFWRRKNFRKTAAFTVLMAYGYDLAYGPHPEPPDPFMGPPTNYHRGRLLAAMVFPTPNREAWAQFLGSRDGDPAVVVADGSKAITRALAHRWPRARGVTPPEFVRCQWHLANNLRKAAGRDIKRINATRTGAGAATEALLHPDTHPLVADAAGAVSRPKAWRDYRDMAYALLGHHRAFTDERPSSVLAWLHDRESLVLSQQARRGQRLGPASIGPLEGHIGTVRPWLARRAQAIRNPDRTNLLLALMVEGINHTASRAAWADRIYEELADHDRKPLRTQRRLVGRTF